MAVPPHIRPVLKAHLKTTSAGPPTRCCSPPTTGAICGAANYRTHWEKARAGHRKTELTCARPTARRRRPAAQSGATTAELMHRLGHTTPEMALRYQHVAEGRDAEIAERLSKLAAGGSK